MFWEPEDPGIEIIFVPTQPFQLHPSRRVKQVYLAWIHDNFWLVHPELVAAHSNVPCLCLGDLYEGITTAGTSFVMPIFHRAGCPDDSYTSLSDGVATASRQWARIDVCIDPATQEKRVQMVPAYSLGLPAAKWPRRKFEETLEIAFAARYLHTWRDLAVHAFGLRESFPNAMSVYLRRQMRSPVTPDDFGAPNPGRRNKAQMA